MFRKPNDVFPSNRPLAAADFPRHWKLVLRLFWFIVITAFYGYTFHSYLEKTKPYLTKDLRLLGQVLRSEMKEKMGNGDTEQRSGNDDERIREKAKKIGNISKDLLEKLETPLYFICVAYGGEVLATATPPKVFAPQLSADYLCDKGTIRNHAFSPGGDQRKNFYNVSARKLGDQNIPPTLHSVNDGDETGFHLWMVKRLQPGQADPIYDFVKNDLLYVMLILGIIVLLTYAPGAFRSPGKSLQE